MEKLILLYNNHFHKKYLIVLIFLFIYFYIHKHQDCLFFLLCSKKDNPKISIFLPIYNAENTIKKSIESIQHQTLKQIEIIAVNDFSNDTTLSKLTELALNDDRIRIINNDKNRGLLYSRAMGILNSRGEYLMNLDADDEIIGDDSLEYLYNIGQSLKLDIVSFDIIDVKKNATINCSNYNEIQSQPNLFQYIFINNFIKDFMIWNKIIKKEIFIKAYKSFRNQIYNWRWNYFEDDIWNILVHRNARSKICLNRLIYIYNFNNNSLMNKGYELIHFKNLMYRHEMYEKIFKKKEDEKYLIAEYYFLFNRLKSKLNNLLLINDNQIKKYFINIYKHFLDNYNCTIEKRNDINSFIQLIK